jgi:hypothetical protein
LNRIDNPLAMVVVGCLMIFGLLVAPLMHPVGFRPRVSKVVASVIALAYAAYFQTAFPMLLCLWPLSLIWFPEYWGQYSGRVQGTHINEPSPPILVSLLGWAFLILFPILFSWITNFQL